MGASLPSGAGAAGRAVAMGLLKQVWQVWRHFWQPASTTHLVHVRQHVPGTKPAEKPVYF
jgi:hypothetical protein